MIKTGSGNIKNLEIIIRKVYKLNKEITQKIEIIKRNKTIKDKLVSVPYVPFKVIIFGCAG